MITALEFFATPGRMTSPGDQAGLLEHLPCDVGSLRQVVQGLMIHVFWAEQYGVQLAGPRRDEVQLRPVVRKLERIIELDPRPLVRNHASNL